MRRRSVGVENPIGFMAQEVFEGASGALGLQLPRLASTPGVKATGPGIQGVDGARTLSLVFRFSGRSV